MREGQGYFICQKGLQSGRAFVKQMERSKILHRRCSRLWPTRAPFSSLNWTTRTNPVLPNLRCSSQLKSLKRNVSATRRETVHDTFSPSRTKSSLSPFLYPSLPATLDNIMLE